MATTLRELLVKIGVDADTEELEAFDGAVERGKEALGNLVQVATAAAAAVAAVAAATIAGAVSTAGYARTVEQSAETLGLTTQQYQELAYAIEKTGGTTEDLATLLTKLTLAQQGAASGSQAQIDAFKALGLTMEQVKAADPAELLRLVADGMARTASSTERLAAANAIFGDDLARKVIPVLSLGADGLERLGIEAEQLGLVMSEDALQAATDFGAQVSVLEALAVSLRNELSSAVIPTLIRLTSEFLTWVQANRDLIGQQVGSWAESIGAAFSALANAIKLVNSLVGGVQGWEKLTEILATLTGAAGIAYVAVQFISLASAVSTAITAFIAFIGPVVEGIVLIGQMLAIAAEGGVLFEAFAAVIGGLVTPVGLVVAAIAAFIAEMTTVFLVLQDFWTYLQGGDSVFGRLIEKWRQAPGLLGAISRFLSAIGQLGGAAIGVLSTAWDAFASAMQPVIDLADLLASVLLDKVGAALDALAPILDAATAGLNAVTSALGGNTGAPNAGAGTYTASSSAPASSSSYAPASASSGYGTASSAAGTSSTSRTVSQTVQGDTITITGIGISAEEATTLIERVMAEKARLVSSSYDAAEV